MSPDPSAAGNHISLADLWALARSSPTGKIGHVWNTFYVNRTSPEGNGIRDLSLTSGGLELGEHAYTRIFVCHESAPVDRRLGGKASPIEALGRAVLVVDAECSMEEAGW